MRKTVTIADDLVLGGDTFVVMAGPCAVETRDLLFTVADAVAAAGAGMLRGGAFKPRTSPQSFQGLGAQGLAMLQEASRRTGLPVVTEVLDTRDVDLVADHCAMLQIGSRNMQNFALLREVGKLRKPVLLKRGAAATLDELLFAADYVLQGGNDQVVLCERGIRGFDPATRYVLDLAAVAVLKERTSLPVIVDPSHGTGRAALVPALARAALAVGADGLLVEVHAAPEQALCDGMQALRPSEFAALMADLRRLLPVLGRRLVRTSGRGHAVAHPGSGPVSDEVIAP
ncbi:MAG: 3-deoxy-7-phosphoheptulonate synthase [Planctomycetes bacterium]|nr:3-deoxy-7-phosphoheptulonate synthase [Planctomycetota bacterium]